MIRVAKGDSPAYLKRVAPAAKSKLIAAAAAGKPPKADKSKYGHPSVRQRLADDQHGKCCYCEVKIPVPYAHQHVEHFRPQSQTRQNEAAPPTIPGYFWLSYEWSNLFLSCSHCNSSYKRDIFPLLNSNHRALGPLDDIAREIPLLLNPAGPEDPEDHIEFHDEVPKGKSAIGRCTIEVIGLGCPQREDRLEYLNYLRKLRNQIIVLIKDGPTHATKQIINENYRELLIAQRRSSKYSAMARTFMAKNPIVL